MAATQVRFESLLRHHIRLVKLGDGPRVSINEENEALFDRIHEIRRPDWLLYVHLEQELAFLIPMTLDLNGK
ncbi:MAG: hypothetical protein AAF802_08195 [Planctomycetota bacterium]